jgi:hypothetical protein
MLRPSILATVLFEQRHRTFASRQADAVSSWSLMHRAA